MSSPVALCRVGSRPIQYARSKVDCIGDHKRYLTAHADSFQSDPFDIFAGIRAQRVTGISYLPVTKRTLCRRPDRVSETTTYRNIIYRLLPGSRETRGAWQDRPEPAASSGTRCRGGTMPPARLRRRAETSRRPSRSSRPARNSPHSETRSRGFQDTRSTQPAMFSSTRPMRGRRSSGARRTSALQVDIRNDPVIHHSRHGPHQRRHDHHSEDRPHAHSPEGREPVPRRQAGESRDQEDRGQVVRHRLLRGRGSLPDMKTKLRLQRLQRKRAHRRSNWQHRTSRRIAARQAPCLSRTRTRRA